VNAGVLFEPRQERIVGLLVAFLENMLEITCWLVGVNDKE
jgi:hypothetical protein